MPQLLQTDPSGISSSWKATSIGRSSKTVREFLEKNYVDNQNLQDSIKLAIKALLEVVQTGAKNIDIAYMTADKERVEYLPSEEVERIAQEIEKEKEAEAEKKKKPVLGASSQ